MRSQTYGGWNVRTKTAISQSELNKLQLTIDAYRRHKTTEQRFAVEVAEILGCDIEDAWNVLARHDTAHNVLRRCSLEIAPDDEPDVIPIEGGIDRDTWRLWAFMAGGFFLVCGLVVRGCVL